MAYVSDVFNAAMALMDELAASGQAQTADTKEYEYRTPGIVNMMVAEMNLLLGQTWSMVSSMTDQMDADDNFALSALPYGLGANLLVDENAAAASFYQQRYEELKRYYISTRPAELETVEDVYDCASHNEFSRW